MKRLIKILGFTLAATIGLIVVAVIIFTFFLDANKYREDISRIVQEKTGRAFEIKGNLSYSVFPWVGIRIGETRMGNARGFEGEDFARIKEVEVRVEVIPLLSRKLVMDTVTLDGLQLNLGKNRQGVTNWADLTKPSEKKAGKPARPHEPGEKPALAGLSINGIRITNARVVWSDQQTNTRYVLDKFRFTSGAIGDSKPVKFDLAFNVQDAKSGQSWPFEVSNRFTLNMDKQVMSMDDLKMNLAGLKFNGNIKGNNIMTSPAFNGKLVSAAFVPRDVLKSLGIGLPASNDQSVFGKASMDFVFSASPTRFDMSKLVMKLDDTKLDGKFSVQNFQKPAIRFDLTVDDIDADRYLPPSASEKKKEKAQKTAAAGKTGLPMDMLRGLDVSGSFRIGKLKAYNLKSESILFTLNANRGLIRVHPAQAKMYGGSYNGDLQLDVRGKTPVLSMNEVIQGVQAEPLFKDAADMKWISGQADLSAKLTGQGLAYEEMRKTLNGNIKFSFANGSINGVNIPLMIRKAYATLKGLPAPPNEPEKTDFTALTGTATVKNGLVDNRDLAVSTPLLRINGAGTADLVSEQVDYLVKASVVASLQGQGGDPLEKLKGVTIPVRVKGPFSKPGFKVELGEVLKEETKKKVEEKVKEKLKLDDKLKKLFR